MFNTKPVVKKTLIEEATLLVEESKGIKSIFSKMKTDLENKNIALGEKADQIAHAMTELANAQTAIGKEAMSNDKVIKEITKIEG